MAKLNMEGAPEYSPGLPPGNYHLEILDEWDRTKNSNDHRMYVVQLSVVEPKQLAGRIQRDWFTVGTDDDPLCKKDETTEDPSNVGAGRLKRLLNKSHTAATNDDEQWMQDSPGNIVGAEIRTYTDRNGVKRTGINYEFPEDVEPGLTEGEESSGGRRRGGKKGPAQAARAARGKRGGRDADEEETEEEEPRRGRRDRDEEGEEDPRARKRSRRDSDEEEEEEEEEEERPRRGRRGQDADEEEAEEEAEEEEEEKPRRGKTTRGKAAPARPARGKRR